jgi:hypothetical protein
VKRSAAPTRRTGLKPGKQPQRSALKRSRSVKNNFGDEVKAEVRRRSGNMCEICHTAPAAEFHHRKLRQHGDNRACNCLHLCKGCHTAAPHAVHRNYGKSYLMGWLVRSCFDPAEVPVKRS